MLQTDNKLYVELNKMPRYVQIKYELQQFLANNNWKFDKPIPSEQELSAKYAASIGTIRKAVECLVEEGILIKHQGKGTFLKHPAFIKSSLSRFYLPNDKNGEVQVPVGIVKCVAQIHGDEKINSILCISSEKPLLYLERIRLISEKVILSDKIWLPLERFSQLKMLSLEEFDDLLYPMFFLHCGQLVVSAKEQLTFLADYSDPYLTNNQKETVVKICRRAKGLDGSILEYRESYGLAQDFYYETIIT